jgi:hypothetical protein
MSMNLPISGGREFERVPGGMHPAICNLLVDAGMQPGSSRYPQPKHRIYLRFETPDHRITYKHNGQDIEGPLTIGIWYVASMNAKSILRKHLEGWMCRRFTDKEAAAFDVESVLGKPCTLMVTETEQGGKTFSNIAAIGSAPKGVVLKPENPLLFYGPDSPRSDYEKLPDWMRKRIDSQAQVEPPASAVAGGSEYQPWPEDDIPF